MDSFFCPQSPSQSVEILRACCIVINSALAVETQCISFRYLQYNHYRMTTMNNRLQILESLGSLDQAQTEKVLEYIQSLTHNRDDRRRQVLKSQALSEIRQALGNGLSLTRVA
jgi:hypothetical protein